MADSITTERTIVGLFESVDEANLAVDALVKAGFGRDEIGVISGHELSKPELHVNSQQDTSRKMIGAVEKGLGFGGGLGALAGGVSSLLIPGVGPIVIGGALAAAFLGAGLGAAVGGVMGGLMKAGVDESDARLFEAALRSGGVVVTVHTDEVRSQQAVGILDANGALDMDSHRDKIGDRGTDVVEGATDTRRNDTHREHSSVREQKDFGAGLEQMALDENARRLDPWMKHGAILGGNANPEDFEHEYRQDYQDRYAGTGVGFDRFLPAYLMGQQFAQDSRFVERDWSASEADIRKHWESSGHNGSWDEYQHAVRHGWDRGRSR